MGKMTGLSRAQVTRLVGRYVATGQRGMQSSHRHRFPQRYTRADIELLAAYPEPVLAAMLTQFPFVIRGFHSDNGSEFINQTVAKLLNKLMIQQRKSRPRHSNDNGLAETKNGAIIRKPMGWGHNSRQARRTHPAVLQRLPESLFEPSPALWAGRHRRDAKDENAVATAVIQLRWRHFCHCPMLCSTYVPDSRSRL